MRLRALAFVCFMLLFCCAARAQTLYPFINPHEQFLDTNGKPLAQGKVYTYVAGSTTKVATYKDAGAVASNTNPIILDSAGFALIYLDQTKSLAT